MKITPASIESSQDTFSMLSFVFPFLGLVWGIILIGGNWLQITADLQSASIIEAFNLITAILYFLKIFISMGVLSWRKSRNVTFKTSKNKTQFLLDICIGVIFIIYQLTVLSKNTSTEIPLTTLETFQAVTVFFTLFFLPFRILMEFMKNSRFDIH